MLELYNEDLAEAKLRRSWSEAYIMLILKEDTDHQQIKNCKLISLLNANYKIFAVIIAERVKKLLNEIIHTDQNGFLPKRQIKNNTRIVMNVLEFYEAHPKKQAALEFLDMQKPFNNLNWQFLIQQLKTMKFRETFVRIITAISSTQTANVILNGGNNRKFNIAKGVRQ